MTNDQIRRVRERYGNDTILAVKAVDVFMREAIGLGEDRVDYYPGTPDWYTQQIHNRIQRWIMEMENPQYLNSILRVFFENNGIPPPMTSLRDVDEAGKIKVAVRSVEGRRRLPPQLVREVMRILRQGGSAWGEEEDDLVNPIESE